MQKADIILKEFESGQFPDTVLAARAAGQKWVQVKVSLIDGGRMHARVRAKALLNKPGSSDQDSLDSVSNALNPYCAAVAELKVAGLQTEFWKAENVQTRISEMFAKASEAEIAFTVLEAVDSSASEQRRQNTQLKDSEKRGAVSATNRCIKPYLDLGMAPTWANCLQMLNLGQLSRSFVTRRRTARRTLITPSGPSLLGL